MPNRKVDMEKSENQPTPEEFAHSSLLSYVGMQYPKYYAEPMHELIATALEAVEAGAIRRLLISAPPQHGKSLLTSEMFPPWALGRNPDWKIIAATYNQTRANEVGGVVRNFLTNEIQRMVFPNCEISSDTKSVHHVATTQRGHYYSIGVGGTGTGRGANCLPAETILSVEIDGVKKELDIETIYSLFNKSTSIKVLSFDHQNGLPIYKNIIAAQVLFTNELHKITTKSKLQLYLTKNHPVFTTLNFYVNAANLQVGDKTLVSAPQIKQESIIKIDHINTKPIPVYDIQVEGTSNFFANKILTHNCFLVDDPLKGREDAESKLVREKIKEWYRAVVYTRLRPDNRIVIISTRWHLDDLVGFVQTEHPHENWKIIELRAVAEEDDVLGRAVGEPLCPSMYSKEHLEMVKTVEGTYNWEALYQQRPVAKKGGMVQYEWIKHYTNPPDPEEILKTVISWDTAYKADQLNDPTAATVWYITKTNYYLVDVFNQKLEFPALIRKIKSMHEIHHPSIHLIEGRASGQSVIQELKRTTSIPIAEISTKNIEKEVRFDAITGFFESGKVWLPEKAHWLQETEDQLCLFPSTKYDDIADSASQFLNWVNKPRYVPRPPSKLYWK